MPVTEKVRPRPPHPERLQQRRFRRRRWSGRANRLRPILFAIGAVVLVGVAVWVLWFSSLLAVRHVSIRGGQVLNESQLRTAADVPLGEPLASVDTGAIARRLEQLLPVQTVRVSRAWPHTLDIVVTERTAVAVVARGSSYAGLDASGVVFRDYPRRPRHLALIEAKGAVSRSVLREAAAVLASLPADLAHRVRALHAATIDQISLQLRDGKTVVWGSAADARQKSEVLALMLRPGGPAAHKGIQTVDVSVPGRPTTR